MTVYGDLLFLINFSMDFLCFYLSHILFGERIKTFRACIAAVIGGIYSVAALFIDAKGALAFAIDISVLLLMCAVAYFKRGLGFGGFVKRVALYFLVSSLLGGFMTAMFSFLNRIELFGTEMGIDEGLDVWIFAVLALASAFLTLNGGAIFRTSNRKKAIIEIAENQKMVRLHALVDTGNLAYEPISGKSVVFARLDRCKDLFSDRDYLSLKNRDGIEEMPTSLAMRVRPIFSRSIGGDALLPAVRFKCVRLVCGKRVKELDIYIAFLSGDEIKGYEAIISNELIT